MPSCLNIADPVRESVLSQRTLRCSRRPSAPFAFQVAKLEASCDQKQEKVRELKRSRQELYDKLLATREDSAAAHEQRLQAEIARIEARARADLEQIQREAEEARGRELRALRDMRDAAALEAERAQAKVREGAAVYEELLLR
jgi:progesterone-induced-blocking factor 1